MPPVVTNNLIEIENNLDFEDGIIKGLTVKGLYTIKKYNLGKSIYNTLHAKELKNFTKFLYKVALHGLKLDKVFFNML